jgi:hypothetical protein
VNTMSSILSWSERTHRCGKTQQYMGEGQVFKPEHGNGLIVRSQKKEEEEKKKKMMINITIEVYLDPALHLSKPFKTKMTTKFNVGLPFKV